MCNRTFIWACAVKNARVTWRIAATTAPKGGEISIRSHPDQRAPQTGRTIKMHEYGRYPMAEPIKHPTELPKAK